VRSWSDLFVCLESMNLKINLMKRFLFLLSFILFGTQILSAQVWDNIVHAGGGSGTGVSDVALDQWGNIYTVGQYSAPLDFGDTAFVAGNTNPIFLTKHDSMGNRIWIKTFSASWDAFGQNVEVGPDGNVYMIGMPGPGFITIDSTTFFGYFILKLDSAGNNLWSQPFEATGFQPDLVIDDLGNVYITYTNYTSGFFGDIFVDNSGGVGNDIGVGMMDSTGDAQWAVKLETEVNGLTARGIDVNNQGQVAITGRFRTTLDVLFNTINVMGHEAYLVILDAGTGATLAATNSVSPNEALGTAVLADDSGNFVIAGSFKDSVSFGSIGLSSVGNQDLFITSYDNNLNVNWVRQISATDINSGDLNISDMGADDQGNYYLSGKITAETIFGTDTVYAFGKADVFIAKYDLNGNYHWNVTGGSNDGGDEATGIDVRDNGSMAVCGDYSNSAGFFGNDTLPGLASKHIFISGFRDTAINTTTTPTFILPRTKAENEVLVYPNPASNMIYFKTSIAISSIELYDNTLRRVHVSPAGQSSGKVYSMDTSKLKSGVYFLTVQYKEGQIRKKIVLIK